LVVHAAALAGGGMWRGENDTNKSGPLVQKLPSAAGFIIQGTYLLFYPS
jgi:hypothetical protein